MQASRHATPLLLALPLALTTATCALAAPQTSGGPSTQAVIQVTNCNDSGAGSLRAAVATAASGDNIELRSLDCRRIDLTSGTIQIPQDHLTLLGPPGMIMVAGDRTTPVFEHSGAGTLRIRALEIAHGRHSGRAVTGGCIDSQGDLWLEWSHVHDCTLDENAGFHGGGGGIAGNDVTLYDSVVYGNHASTADASAWPRGGGILARDHLTLVRSRVVGNTSLRGYGGGLYAFGGLYMLSSEVSDNFARYDGALTAVGDDITIARSLIAGNESYVSRIAGLGGPDDRIVIQVMNTTVSGNVAEWQSGLGFVAPESEMSLVNSTVAFNTEDAGLCLGAVHIIGQLHMESTLVAKNTCNGNWLDIGHDERDAYPQQIIGRDNLVRVSTLPLPADTISANPRISPLADNGGRTRSHALWPRSPAVDMGNNAAGLDYDQRGWGFPRVNGGRADIGAYER